MLTQFVRQIVKLCLFCICDFEFLLLVLNRVEEAINHYQDLILEGFGELGILQLKLEQLWGHLTLGVVHPFDLAVGLALKYLVICFD
jgi:hypothetical protein